MKTKMLRRITALFMAITMLAVTLFAQQQPVLAADKSAASIPAVASEEDLAQEALIVDEIVDKRTADTKYYLMDDMSYLAAQYDEPVHYMKDGEWKEIDNSLISEFVNGEEVYTNQKSDIDIMLAANSLSNKLVEISTGGYNISWSIDSEPNTPVGSITDDSKSFRPMEDILNNYKKNGIQKANFKAAQNKREDNIQKPAKKGNTNRRESEKYNKEVKEYNDKKMSVQNISSSGKYIDILQWIDIEYIVTPEGLKENIILKDKKAANCISFTIAHKGLSAKLEEDGSISLFEAANPQYIIFKFATPFMFDSNEEYSNAVKFELLELKGEEKSIITIRADENWLNESSRQYPVTIDPVVLTKQGSGNTPVSYFTESNYNLSATGTLYVGNQKNQMNKVSSAVKIDTLPVLNKGDVVVSATLNLYQKKYDHVSSPENLINVYEITGNWNATTGGGQMGGGPAYNSNAVDSAISSAATTNNWMSWEVTPLVRKWYDDPSTNKGIFLRANNTDKWALTDFVAPKGTTWTTDAKPVIAIGYRNHNGLEDNWTYHSQSNGKNGTGYINDFTGNLVYQIPILSVDDALMPFSVDFTFNSSEAGTVPKPTYNNNNNNRWGLGFRMSMQQRIDDTGIEDYPKVYTDGDGTKHYFGKDNLDEDGLGYTLSSISEGELVYQITNIENTVTMKFDCWGYLRRIYDQNNNWISINYGPNQPVGDNFLGNITTNSGAFISFIYDGTKVSSIIDNAGRTTNFRYDNNGDYLTNIDYPDGTSTRIDYTGILTVTGSDGSNLSYTGDGRNRVTKVTENSTNLESKTLYTVEYKDLYETKYTYPFTNVPTRYETVQFDNYGMTKCVFDGLGNAANANFDKSGDKRNRGRLLQDGSSTGYAHNYIYNPNFTNSVNGWVNWTNGGTFTDKGFLVGNAAKISYASGRPDNQIVQCPTLTVGKTYTYSAYVKTENVSAEGGGAYIQAVFSDGSVINSEMTTGTTDSSIDEGWQRVSLTIPVTKPFDRIGMGLYNAAGGTAYFSNPQLEEGDIANRYNLIENSGFEFNSGNKQDGTPPYNWTRSAASAPGDYGGNEMAWSGTGRNGSYSARFDGNSEKNKGIYTTIPVSGPEGDTYHLSGWAIGNALLSTDSDTNKNFRIQAEISYTTGESRKFYADFNKYVTGWQYASAIISTSDGDPNTNRTYSSIKISIEVNKQMNAGFCFDDIQLVKDTGESYQYDKNGNLISTADLAKQNDSFSYNDNNQISKMVSPAGTSFEYSYDGNKNIVAANTAESVSTKIAYNGNGTVLGTRLQNSNTGAIEPGRTYYIRNKVSGKCLSVENSSEANLSKIVQYQYNEGNNQKWKVVDAGDGYFYLQSFNGVGRNLDIYGATTNHIIAQIHDANTSDAQKFKLDVNPFGWYQISPKCAPNNVLTNNGGSLVNSNYIQSWGNGKGADQYWCFQPADEPAYSTSVMADKMYAIRCVETNKVIDATGNTLSSPAVQTTYNISKTQMFVLKDAGSGYYRLVSAEDNRVLAFDGTADGSLLKGVAFAENDFQKWSITIDAGNRFKIINKASGKCIDVAHWSYDENAAIAGYTFGNNQTNQTWYFEEVSLLISSEANYTSDNRLASITDHRGKITTYSYEANANNDKAKGLLTSTTDANNVTTTNEYKSTTDQLTKTTTNGVSVSYGYNNNNGSLASIGHNGFSYGFLYDNWGNVSKIQVGVQDLVTNVYETNRDLLTGVNYANGQKITNDYDPNYDRITARKNGVTGALQFSYQYDSEGRLATVDDKINNVVTNYNYDLIGRIASMNASNGFRMSQKYDAKNRLESYTTNINGTSYTTGFKYGNVSSYQKVGLIYGVTLAGSDKISYSYDKLTRLSTRKLNGAGDFTTTYSYLAGIQVGKTTTLIDTMENGNTALTYTYDNIGNIKTIYENGTLQQTYNYDALNQLIRHDDAIANKSYTYTYDYGGNITAKNSYDYTTGDLGAAEPATSMAYSYTDNVWKDKLTQYTIGGTAYDIVYDASGNPLNYGGKALSWQNGRQLASYQYNGESITYQYNDEGIRTQKSFTNSDNTEKNTTEYFLNGDKIIRQTTKNISGAVTSTLDFFYDEKEEAYGFKHNNVDYYYVRNAQNDIIEILDSSGISVVKYTYDAWGKLLTTTGTLAETIGKENPLRYRGYYYDAETGFYSLLTRYYDPATGRFINADDSGILLEDQDSVQQYNLYAYCFNNPINMDDQEGESPANIIGGIIGGATGAALGVLLAKKLGLTGWKKWALISAATIGGAVLGAFLGPYVAKLAKAAGSAIKAGVKSTTSILKTASNAAFKAAKGVNKFSVSAKHLLGAGGRYAKFATSSQSAIRGLIKTALTSSAATFHSNGSDGSYYILYNFGRAIGTKGEQVIKVVFDTAGKIWTAFPVK